MNAIRLDRATLRRPRTRDDGTVVYEGVLVSVGDRLQYGDRTETPSREALSDPDYLDGLTGLRLLLHHGEGLIGRDIPVDHPSVRHVGTVLSARFDEAAGSVVVEMAVHDDEALRAIRSGVRELSEGYRVPRDDERIEDDGTITQMRRIPNHVALERAGRSPSTVVRIDSAGGFMPDTQTPEQTPATASTDGGRARNDADEPSFQDRYDAMVAERDKARSDMEAMKGQYDAMKAKMDALMEALGMEEREDKRMDAAGVTEAFGKIVSDRIASLVSLRETAARMDVSLEDDVTDPDAIRKQIAKALGGEESRLDSADYCDGLIAAASRARQDSAGTFAAKHRQPSHAGGDTDTHAHSI